MEPSIPAILKDKDKGKTLDGFGIALVATTLDLTTRTGMDQEIAHHLDCIFLLKIIMLWICPPLSTKLQMTKNTRNTERLADALNAESKATLFTTVLTKRHALVQLILFKLKMMISQLSPKPLPCLQLLLHE